MRKRRTDAAVLLGAAVGIRRSLPWPRTQPLRPPRFHSFALHNLHPAAYRNGWSPTERRAGSPSVRPPRTGTSAPGRAPVAPGIPHQILIEPGIEAAMVDY